ASAPEDLRELAPRRDPVMPARRKSPLLANGMVQPAPAPHSRSTAIRADNPARGYERPWHMDSVGRNSRHRSSPQQVHTTLLGPHNHPRMQHGAPNPQPYTAREFRGNLYLALQETNTTEGETHDGRNFNAQFGEGCQCFRQKAFAASLVNRGRATIRYSY